MQFHIEHAGCHAVVNGAYAKIDGYKVVGYTTVGVNHPVESDFTTSMETATAWCDAANRGERPAEAKWASYNDD